MWVSLVFCVWSRRQEGWGSDKRAIGPDAPVERRGRRVNGGECGRAVTDFLNNEHGAGSRPSPPRLRCDQNIAGGWGEHSAPRAMHTVRGLRKPYSRAMPQCTTLITHCPGDRMAAINNLYM